MEELAGGWRRLHNEELHNLYASPHIIRVIKSRRMRWAGHVERLMKMRFAYNILVGKLGRLGVDGKILLEWILRKYGGRVWSEFFWLRMRTSGGLL
jgi:hypothetical protein